MKQPSKAKKRALVLVHGDDWVGLYEDDQIVFQDHRLAPGTLVDLEISSGEWKKMQKDAIYAEDYNGHFPDSLKDLKQELKLHT